MYQPYTLPLKHNRWVPGRIRNVRKAGIISWSLSSWLIPIVITQKKAQPGEQLQKELCVYYHASNSLLSPVVQVHSKTQGVISLISLSKID